MKQAVPLKEDLVGVDYLMRMQTSFHEKWKKWLQNTG